MTTTIKWFLTDQSWTSFPITWSFSLQFKWKIDTTKNVFSLKFFSQHAHLHYHQFPKSSGYHGRDRQCLLQSTQVNICCGFHFDGSLYLFSLPGISSTALGIRALWWALFTCAIRLATGRAGTWRQLLGSAFVPGIGPAGARDETWLALVHLGPMAPDSLADSTRLCASQWPPTSDILSTPGHVISVSMLLFHILLIGLPTT